MKGIFITVEGMDGCGKTTQIENMVQYFQQQGKAVTVAREPGATKLGEQIRELLLDIKNNGMNPAAELMLYAAARAELVSKVILPAVNDGRVVICDRFVDSSIAYQGFGRNLGVEMVEQINYYALQGCKPDMTILFDISPQEVSDRKDKLGKKDRIEAEAIEFHHRVYEGYLEMAEKNKDRIKLIDARKTIEEVFNEVKIHLDFLIYR